mgnify:CR=1 FL=1
MFAQLMRCICSCVPRRNGAGGDRSAVAQPPQGETQVPPALAPLLDIEGIGRRTVQYLADAGYASVEQVRRADRDELAAVEGVGPRSAEVLKRALDAG